MKKTLILMVMLWMCSHGQLFAHLAKKEVQKDDTMIKLDHQVRALIVEQGDYDAALKVYASAARQHTDKPYYKEQYAILRRVIKMKRALETFVEQEEMSEGQAAKWMSYYLAVRGYYYAQGLYGESVNLDKVAADRRKVDQTVINYLESLVVLNQTESAQSLIDGASETLQSDPGFSILAALVQVRTNKAETAVEVCTLDANPKENPVSFVYLGCIYQRQGDSQNAYQSITIALENTPPTQISMTRKLIENMKEFESIRQTEKYMAAIKTESKVYQSGCTGGSSCNSCSLKDKCSSNN